MKNLLPFNRISVFASFYKKVTVANFYYIKASMCIVAGRVMCTSPHYTGWLSSWSFLPNARVQLNRKIYPDKHLRDCTAGSASLPSSAPQIPCIPLWSMPFSNLLELTVISVSMVPPPCKPVQVICPLSPDLCSLKALVSYLGLEDQAMLRAHSLLCVHFWYFQMFFHSSSIDSIFSLLKFSTITLLPHLKALTSTDLHWNSDRN